MKEKVAQNLQASEEWQDGSSIFKWGGGGGEAVHSLLYPCSISILSTGKTEEKSKLLTLAPY